MPPVAKPKRKRERHFIKEWRSFRGKTQEQLAEALEVNQSSISNLENGKTPYDQDVLEKIALYFGCEPEDLLMINPLRPDPLRTIWSDLEKAPDNVKARALGYLEGLLKAG
jgi:transcriptional regulator with XRE-family HTH domain